MIAHLPPERLTPSEDSDEGARLVRLLRRVGSAGGIPIAESDPLDAQIAPCLFADASTAVRNASMRRVLSAGADSNDIRALEDLVAHLSRVPDDGWEGAPEGERKRRFPGVERRRIAVRRRELRRERSER